MRGPSPDPVDIHTTRVGSGPPAVFVHGAMTSSAQTWSKQMPLSDRWTLVLPDRRGYEPNPPEDRSDFEVDAADIAVVLGDGAHLVGHSYGAVGAMFAAASRPDAVWSLTVIEPPAHCLARGNPDVEAQIAGFHDRHERLTEPEAFMRGFLEALGAPTDNVPSPLPADLERRVRILMSERRPWDAPLPVETLRAAAFPMLVVSGGHNPTFEMLCDRLADAVGGATRVAIAGAGHVVQRTGERFNETLERFFLDAEATRAALG